MKTSLLLNVVACVLLLLFATADLPAAEPGPVDIDAPNAFTKSDSGLAYRIRRRSTGQRPGRGIR